MTSKTKRVLISIPPDTWAVVDEASVRTGLSRSAVVDILARLYGPHLTAESVPAALMGSKVGRHGGGRRKKKNPTKSATGH